MIKFDIYSPVKDIFIGKKHWWNSWLRKFEMEINENDRFDLRMDNRCYNSELVLFVAKFLKKGNHVIDGGAQKGYITLHAAKRVGKKGRVFSFEPDPRAREILIKNLNQNRIKNVTVFNNALGEEKGNLKFHLSSQLGWSAFVPNKKNEKYVVSAIDVEVDSLDHIFNKYIVDNTFSKLSLIKLDCEGAEPLILKGMNQIATKFHPILWIEINIRSLSATNSSEKDVEQILSGYGYSLYRPFIKSNNFGFPSLTLNKYLPFNESERYVFDIVAIHKESIDTLSKSFIME